MVHALYEARRVLVPQGILIDLRPHCVAAPLEIVFEKSFESAGLVDMSLNIAHDLAADKAISIGVREGVIKELRSEYFDIAYYWNSVNEMVADIDENWKEDVILPEEVVRRASILYKKHHAHARLRIPLRMKQVTFEKV
jgi:hypothetical protein